VCFNFLFKFVWNSFNSRKTERDATKNVYLSVCEVPPFFFLSYFNETWIFPTDFRKILKYQFSWKSFQWLSSCSVRKDRRTDMKKQIVTFRNFEKSLKKTRPKYSGALSTWKFMSKKPQLTLWVLNRHSRISV
jgi:hypothetical protein